MNDLEREQLTALLNRLTQVQLMSRDAEAERLISEAVARQPDAAYLLVQRVLLQERALQTAHDDLRRLQAAPAGASLLGDTTWGGQARPLAPPPVVTGAGGTASSGAPGWLGTVATTAAGVVAGSFLYQGIEHLLAGAATHPPSQGLLTPGETVANNSYGDDLGALSDGLAADGDSEWL
ncbi:DUF2076 domain-containing protein [Dechloromonas sp. ZY10]|uniref:DUF2076 domain-containing protein n=1 Tax=Dechloromonas aquae TaxID=2664436 RepID=UPI0035290BDA